MLQLDYIGEDLNNPSKQTWVPNELSLVQAVIGPVISSASDLFQARKSILVGSCVLSFIGAAIVPGSKDIYRIIAAQTLIGFGFATVPLAYSVPSEILPRRWRPRMFGILIQIRECSYFTDNTFFSSGTVGHERCCGPRRLSWAYSHWSSDGR